MVNFTQKLLLFFGRVFTAPFFEKLEAFLPVSPAQARVFNDAMLGAVVINIEWFINKSDASEVFSASSSEIFQNEFSVFGKVHFFIKMEVVLANNVSTIQFVVTCIQTTVSIEQTQNVSAESFVWKALVDWVCIEIERFSFFASTIVMIAAASEAWF